MRDVLLVVIALALCAAMVVIMRIQDQIAKIHKWIAHHDYQQSIQGLMGMGQSQMSASAFEALAAEQRKKP